MRNRTVELLECIAQRDRKAGIPERDVDMANVNLQGTGIAGRATKQGSQRGVFVHGELADAKAFDRGVERCSFEPQTQALA